MLQPPLTLAVIPDFSVSSATPTQTVTTGQTTGPYQLAIAPNLQGFSFAGAVTLILCQRIAVSSSVCFQSIDSGYAWQLCVVSGHEHLDGCGEG